MSLDLKLELKKHLASNSKIAIACSGGVDSMVLLSLTKEILNSKDIYCVHYDHKVRIDSQKAVEFLEAYCQEFKINFILGSRTQNIKSNSENELRKLRYSFFEKVCKENDIKFLYQAHNLNDNVETFLFRIFRGTNLSGLSSIPFHRLLNEIDIIRPLLFVTKEQILEYADKHQVKYIEDYTNKEIKYKRNFIRHKILPLAKKINPKFLFNIKKLIDLRIEEEEFLRFAISSEINEFRELPIALEDIRKKSKYIQRKILETHFTTNIDFVNQFLNAIAKGGFHRINFKKNQFFTIKQKHIYLEESL